MSDQKAIIVHNALNNGEVSKRFEPRYDQNKYLASVAELKNFIPMSLGGVKKRVGFRFVNKSRNSGLVNNGVRMVRFKFSNEQVYMLEFGDTYIRFYRDNLRIEPSSIPLELASPYLQAHLPDLYFFQSADELIICHLNYYTRKLMRTAVDTFALQIIQFDPPALTGHEPTGDELAGFI